jgi:hypothetical protein
MVAFLFLISFSLQSLSQKPFLRIYNAGNKKVAKGHFLYTTDSSLVITAGKSYQQIPLSQINVIKSKRTLSNRIAMTSLKVISVALVIGLVLYTISHKHRGLGIKKRNDTSKRKVNPLRRYDISGDTAKWQKQRLLLHQL